MGRMAVLLCGTTLLATMPAHADGGGRARAAMSADEDARLAERELAAPPTIERFEGGFVWGAFAVGVVVGVTVIVAFLFALVAGVSRC